MTILARIFITLSLLVSSIAGVKAQVALSADSISSLLLNHYAKAPQEKMYVHTDRSHYAAGDTMWLRAYCIDAATNQLSDRSKFVYVELLDNSADTLVRRIKIRADTAGVFANALPLSQRLKSGSYTLAAYTQWMRNFDEELFFKKTVKIVNLDDSVAPVMNSRKINSMSLDLMPEGGNLLAGHSQRLAFKAVGDDGLGVDVKVYLVNAAGDVIREGASQHLGMGYIMVNADLGEELWLEAISAEGLSCRTKLPPAHARGVTLSVNQRKGIILIQPSATSDFDMREAALVIYGAGNMIVKELTDDSPIRITASYLKPGVINIALIDRLTHRPLAERLIFVRDRNPAEAEIEFR